MKKLATLTGKVRSYKDRRHNENGPFVVVGTIIVWDDVNNPINTRDIKHIEWDQRTGIEVSLVIKETVVSFKGFCFVFVHHSHCRGKHSSEY